MDVFTVTPHTWDRMTTSLGTLWTKLCFCLITVFCLVCVFSVNKLILFIYFICFNFCTFMFMHYMLQFFGKHTQASKLSGELMICHITIGQGSDVWNIQLISKCLLGNSGHTCLNCSLQCPYTVFMKIITRQIWNLFWD